MSKYTMMNINSSIAVATSERVLTDHCCDCLACLHRLSEKPLETLVESNLRTDIINYTRTVEKYRTNVITAIQSAQKEKD